MGSLNQVASSSSSSKVSDRAKRRKIFKSRSKGLVTKFDELTTLCGCKSLFYLNSEFNRAGLVRMLPENPNEYQEIVKAYKNYDPKRGKGKKVIDSACMNDKPVGSNDQKLISGLSIEEIENMESNLEPMLDKISERIHQLMVKNKGESAEPSELGCCNNEEGMIMMNGFLSVQPEIYQSSLSTVYLGGEFESGEPSEMGCNNEDGSMIMMNGFPSVEPEIIDQSALSTEYLGSEFESGVNRDTGEWISLPAPTDDGIVFHQSAEPSAEKGCHNEDGMIMMNGFPSEFIDQSSAISTDYLGNEIECDYSRVTGEWYNLNAPTDDDFVFDVSDLDQLNSSYGAGSTISFTDMMMVY